MATYRVDELEGERLADAVALAEGFVDLRNWWRMPDGTEIDKPEWRPWLDWEQGGPIIERERIALNSFANGEWLAVSLAAEPHRLPKLEVRGPTLLIAAMRAFVKAKLGEEIDL